VPKTQLHFPVKSCDEAKQVPLERHRPKKHDSPNPDEVVKPTANIHGQQHRQLEADARTPVDRVAPSMATELMNAMTGIVGDNVA
jgi:hypothetical protein